MTIFKPWRLTSSPDQASRFQPNQGWGSQPLEIDGFNHPSLMVSTRLAGSTNQATWAVSTNQAWPFHQPSLTVSSIKLDAFYQLSLTGSTNQARRFQPIKIDDFNKWRLMVSTRSRRSTNQVWRFQLINILTVSTNQYFDGFKQSRLTITLGGLRTDSHHNCNFLTATGNQISLHKPTFHTFRKKTNTTEITRTHKKTNLAYWGWRTNTNNPPSPPTQMGKKKKKRFPSHHCTANLSTGEGEEGEGGTHTRKLEKNDINRNPSTLYKNPRITQARRKPTRMTNLSVRRHWFVWSCTREPQRTFPTIDIER